MNAFKNILFNIFKDYKGKVLTFWEDYDFEVPHYKEVHLTENGLEIDSLDKKKFTADQWKKIDPVDKRKATIKWNKIDPEFQFYEGKNETTIDIYYEYHDTKEKLKFKTSLEITLTKKKK